MKPEVAIAIGNREWTALYGRLPASPWFPFRTCRGYSLRRKRTLSWMRTGFARSRLLADCFCHRFDGRVGRQNRI